MRCKTTDRFGIPLSNGNGGANNIFTKFLTLEESVAVSLRQILVSIGADVLLGHRVPPWVALRTTLLNNEKL